MMFSAFLALSTAPVELPPLVGNQEYVVCSEDRRCYTVNDGEYIGDGKEGWYVVYNLEDDENVHSD